VVATTRAPTGLAFLEILCTVITHNSIPLFRQLFYFDNYFYNNELRRITRILRIILFVLRIIQQIISRI